MTASFIPSLATATSIDDDTQALVLGVIAGDDEPTLVTPEGILSDDAASAVTASLVALGATGAANELSRIPAPTGLGVSWILGVGLGDDDGIDSDRVRQAAGCAARELTGVEHAATTLGVIDLTATAEGFALGAYRFDAYRSDKSRPTKEPLQRITLLVSPDIDTAEQQIDRARAVATAVSTARDFVNTPPNALFPAEFASRAAALATEAGLDVEVLDEKALAEAGYGGIIGVGQGSSRPPRLVRLSYSVGESAPTVALVGKGVTFDTGGISIKPAANMDHMTSDMGGAAAVVATVILAARLGVNVNVTATVPMAENMPSSTAQRPGDVLTQYGGTTVEVLNTDAEGRLILADAIVRALADEPDYLIDVATLTGAQMIALGTRTPGVMGTDDFRDRVAAISQEVGEYGWPMPFPKELRADLKSRIADLANVTNHRYGGMLSAGIFLREFVSDDVQWAHIDVAGPAFNSGGAWGHTPQGGTGVPVRTIFAVIESIAADG